MKRFCPSCQSLRPVGEVFCEADIASATCGFNLTAEPIVADDWQPAPSAPPTVPGSSRCPNGHPLDLGDLICPICQGIPQAAEPPASEILALEPTVIDGWQLAHRFESVSRVRESFAAAHSDGQTGVLTFYAAGSEPDPAVYEVLRILPRDHVPEIMATGRWQERAYEVSEELAGGSLGDLGLLPNDIVTLSRVVEEVGRALHSFAEKGLRHRDLRPGAVLLRSREPLDLVVTGFGSARLSEFDLDIVSPLEVTRYTAPEAVAGGVAAASDWWSLGMILLEQVTRGHCFEGINDQAFLIHVLTNGAPIPDEVNPRLGLLLRGLLARDRRERWAWAEVRRWLDGEELSAPPSASGLGLEEPAGPSISLGGKPYFRPSTFALAAAGVDDWNEARDLFLRGVVTTWVEDARFKPRILAGLRQVANREDLPNDFRLAMALRHLNPAIPFTCRGEIVTPGWLLDHPDLGYELITGPVPQLLDQMGGDQWLVRLKARAEAIRGRAQQYEIELTEDETRIHLLATSRTRLAAQWELRRRLMPDSVHPVLQTILERPQIAEDDLILLLCAHPGQFRTAEEILTDAAEAAVSAGLSGFDAESATAQLLRPRRELYALLEERVDGFARCEITRIDEWVDHFRLERRLSIARLLAVLAVPVDSWRKPPRQEYVEALLRFFAQRVTAAVQRGPLTRMLIGKTTPRADLASLDSSAQTAESILQHLLARNDQMVQFDRDVLLADPALEARIRSLHGHAALYRRDTGIDGLYLGFPFLLMAEPDRSGAPRIAPVLLWPIKLRPEVGGAGRIAVGFDRDREEVRLNPAFEGLLGTAESQRWRDTANTLLQRSGLSAQDVMDAFGTFATPRGRLLERLPGRDLKIPRGTTALACSAVLFHLTYIGQAVAEDLRLLQRIPPKDTGLGTALRLTEQGPRPELPTIPERERYFTAPSDPSQDAAVFTARSNPGLVVEGPPGTGKSQTIVNLVADAIGQGRSMLIVCQKQAALEVVKKRLEAEGLAGRLVMIQDVNRDREPTVRAIREQVEALSGSFRAGLEAQRRQREKLAARIEVLQNDLDEHHEALHRPDARTGLSYRAILGDLVILGSYPERPIDAPELRPLLASLDLGGVAQLQEQCGPLARLWLPARYEDSPLDELTAFGSDAPSLAAFRIDFDAFVRAEANRRDVLDRTPAATEIISPEGFRTWAGAHLEGFRRLAPDERERLGRWLPLFGPKEQSPGGSLLEELEQIRSGLAGRSDPKGGPPVEVVVATATTGELVRIVRMAESLLEPASFLAALSPLRWVATWQKKRHLRTHSIDSDPSTLARLVTAGQHELFLRPWRRRVAKVEGSLLQAATAGVDRRTAGELLLVAHSLEGQVLAVRDLAVQVGTCPEAPRLTRALEAATLEALDSFISGCEQGCERHGARAHARAALAPLQHRLRESWTATCVRAIDSDGTNEQRLSRITQALPHLAAFQRYRVRAATLDAAVIAVLAALRRHEVALDAVAEGDLDTVVRNTIAQEAHLAWKQHSENTQPALVVEADELAAKVDALAKADADIRTLNRTLLAHNIAGRLGTLGEWEPLTRLRGPRALRLREFIDRGKAVGLMLVRPIWLMNPDVASRVLPLQGNLFDTVIYDEASQMPVEYALPSLFRGRSFVVSGDEKQMPPTAFFSSRIENDEAGIVDLDDVDEDASEQQREAHTDTWNRREIKDCPDLLQLAKAAVPSVTLEVHYRSAFRELIAFSNAAFYAGRLHVPCRHPDDEVRRILPVELVRVDGVYTDQTNPCEAQEVANRLAQLWMVPPDQRKTVGVVTFNRKQADLIEEVLERRAQTDSAFGGALAGERERMEDGEDMGFFVKNVENVQGDERDVIIFSSTFGRNSQGTFRRAFGVLGQAGGERRLNVAVSRAREKVILVTSMPINEVSDLLATRRAATTPRDFLQAYLEYARTLTSGEFDNTRTLLTRLSAARKTTGPLSPIEADGTRAAVAEFIRDLGLAVNEWHDDGAFGLDFAIIDPRTGLYGIGIECDAPLHPLLRQARAREMWRPSVLRRAVPVLHRVSSHGWYHERSREQRRLRLAIEQALTRENA